MSSTNSDPPPPHVLLSLRSPSSHFLLVLQSIAHSLAYTRLGGGKSHIKIVEQARKSDPPLLVFGTMNVLREMDLRHPAALFLQEMIEQHHKSFGMGCTTLLTWIGLFAASVDQLTNVMHIHPSILAATLTEIQDLCAKDLKQDLDAPTPFLITLPQLISEYRTTKSNTTLPSFNQSTSSTTTTQLASTDSIVADDAADHDWFFTPTPPSESSSSKSHSPPSTNDPVSLLGFLSFLGDRLSHGQDDPMRAAVTIVHQLLRSQGVRDLDAVLKLLQTAGLADLTDQWDLGAMLTLQATLGAKLPPTQEDSITSEAYQTDETNPSIFTSQWELILGMLLDLFAEDVRFIRTTILHLSTSTTSPTPIVGVVLVLGDVALPEMIETHSLSANYLATAVITASMQHLLEASEKRRDEYLTSLLHRLQSLRISLILSKGSFNREIRQYLRSHHIICLESVNLPKLDALSQFASIPMICELSEVSEAHVGRMQIELRTIGWNPSLVHQNVVREMDKKDDGLPTSMSDMKLCVRRVRATDSGTSSPTSSTFLPYLTLFSTHATEIHSRIFATSFWNCLNRLKHALKDGAVCLGNGQLEAHWAQRLDQQATNIQQTISNHKKPGLSSPTLSSTNADLDLLTQRLTIYTSIADTFRHYLQHLHTNSGLMEQDDVWLHVYANANSNNPALVDVVMSSPIRYDLTRCKLSSLSTVIYLLHLFLHLDATLLCANSRTIYQQLQGSVGSDGRKLWML